MYTREQIEEAGLDDFRVFLVQVWMFLNLPDPTPVQLDIAYNLQHGPRRLIIQAFRGVGKSWITAAYVLWILFLDPQKKIMVVSASQLLADQFSIFCKQLINEMPLLMHLRPNAGQRESNLAFDVGPASPDPAPSVKSVGLTGQLTGSRADVIVADDIEVPKNSYTHVQRERVAELVKEFDAVLKPSGRVVYLGTPQVEASLYNRLPERGYEIRIWPAEVPEKPDVYGTRLAGYVRRMLENGIAAKTPIDPLRFNTIDLDERKASYGHSGYALQFMLDTSPDSAEKHPLKLKDLIVYDVDADMAPVKLMWGNGREMVYQDLHAGGFEGDYYHRPAWKSEEMAKFGGTVMAIDPSGKGKDETAYAIVRFLHGQLFLVASGGLRDGFSEDTLKLLAVKAARYRVNHIIIEENYGGGMFAKLLQPHVNAAWPCQIEEVWHTGQKELRILDTLEPILQSHRLIVDRAVIEEDQKQQADDPKYSLVWQLTRMERTKGALPNEDRLEALEMACKYWAERMGRDLDKALQQHKREKLEEELRGFLDHALGRESKPLRYAGR